MAHIWSDLRFASRTLRAKPVFAAAMQGMNISQRYGNQAPWETIARIDPVSALRYE